MTVASALTSNGVLAVLVLYKRGLEAAVAWPFLLAALGRENPLSLRHCLVFDNSPHPIAPAALPNDVSVVATGANVGTAGAYAAAIALAETRGYDWLLLLDQDTALPADYLELATRTLVATPLASILVPRVRHRGRLISPAVITRTGGVRPSADPRHGTGLPTAISSGLIVRRDAAKAVLPFPPAIWLDYVDHWMFLHFARHTRTIGLIDADLVHDLSVRAPATLSSERLANILAAESAFFARVDTASQLALRLRRMTRAFRYLWLRQASHARVIIGHAFARANKQP